MAADDLSDSVKIADALNGAALAALSDVVPQTCGEAVALWGADAINCPSHEWDNRTTWENTVWLVRRLVVVFPRSAV